MKNGLIKHCNNQQKFTDGCAMLPSKEAIFYIFIERSTARSKIVLLQSGILCGSNHFLEFFKTKFLFQPQGFLGHHFCYIANGLASVAQRFYSIAIDWAESKFKKGQTHSKWVPYIYGMALSMCVASSNIMTMKY